MALRKISPLIWTYLALVGLLAISVGSVFLHLGAFHVVLNLSVSVAKAVLIMLFFMHLKGSEGLVKIAAVAGFFWLVLLFGLSFNDYLTRPSDVQVKTKVEKAAIEASAPARGEEVRSPEGY